MQRGLIFARAQAQYGSFGVQSKHTKVFGRPHRDTLITISNADCIHGCSRDAKSVRIIDRGGKIVAHQESDAKPLLLHLRSGKTARNCLQFLFASVVFCPQCGVDFAFISGHSKCWITNLHMGNRDQPQIIIKCSTAPNASSAGINFAIACVGEVPFSGSAACAVLPKSLFLRPKEVQLINPAQVERCCQRNFNWSLSTKIRGHYEAQSWNHSVRAAQRFCI